MSFYQLLFSRKLNGINRNLTWYWNLFAKYMRENVGRLLAKILKIKGNTLVWNQIVDNGNFTSNSGWLTYRCNLSVSSNVASFEITTAGSDYPCIYRNNMPVKENNKYLISVDCKANSGNVIAVGTYYKDTSHHISATGSWQKICFVYTQNNESQLRLGVKGESCSVGQTIQFKNCFICDLTKMFGSGNEPTIDEFTSLYSLPFYAHDSGSLLSFNGTGIRSSDTSVPKDTKIYGIKRELSTSSTAWTRTDDGVGKTANATHDGTSVTNDFDSIYPWSEIKTVNLADDGNVDAVLGMGNFKWDGSNGEVMTYIPSFYYKRWQDDTYEYMQISQSEFSGSSYSKGFYVGRYTTSSGTHSKSGVVSQASTTITNFRTQAMAKGNNWQQMDYHYLLLQMLYLVEYADYNSQSKLGQGVTLSTTTAQVSSGQLDSLEMKSGCVIDDGTASVIYRGIENIFGNLWQIVDGINFKDQTVYINYNPSSYATDTFDGDYSPVGYATPSSNGYIKTMGYDSNKPLCAFPTAIGGSNYEYIPDYYANGTGSRYPIVGGRFGYSTPAGMFCWSFSEWTGGAYASIGSRLIYNEENHALESYSVTSFPISTYFPTGMKGTGNAYDELTSSKAVTRIREIVADGVNVKVTGGYGAGGPNWLPGIIISDKPSLSETVGNIVSSYLTPMGSSATQSTQNSLCLGNSGNLIVLHIGTMQGTDGTHGYNSASELWSAVNTYLQSNPLTIQYVLATPTEVAIDPPLDLSYPIEWGGTEQLLPENTSTPTTSPILADIQYPDGERDDQYFTYREIAQTNLLGNRALSIMMGRRVEVENPEIPLGIIMRGDTL